MNFLHRKGEQKKRKLIALCVAGCVATFLGACGSSGSGANSSQTVETTPEPTSATINSVVPEPTDTPYEMLFDSNETVNSFLTKYNEIAEYPFDTDEIETGNVRNKAIISTGELYITIYGLDLDNGLSISIEDQDEPSDSFFPTFRDSLKAIDETVTDEQAIECWNELKSLNYMVDINNTGMETPYMVNGIRTGYLNSSIYGEMSRADILYYDE